MSTEEKQVLLQLHDEGKLSTRSLCEEFGINYDEEIERLRKEQRSLKDQFPDVVIKTPVNPAQHAPGNPVFTLKHDGNRYNVTYLIDENQHWTWDTRSCPDAIKELEPYISDDADVEKITVVIPYAFSNPWKSMKECRGAKVYFCYDTIPVCELSFCGGNKDEWTSNYIRRFQFGWTGKTAVSVSVMIEILRLMNDYIATRNRSV